MNCKAETVDHRGVSTWEPLFLDTVSVDWIYISLRNGKVVSGIWMDSGAILLVAIVIRLWDETEK